MYVQAWLYMYDPRECLCMCNEQYRIPRTRNAAWPNPSLHGLTIHCSSSACAILAESVKWSTPLHLCSLITRIVDGVMGFASSHKDELHHPCIRLSSCGLSGGCVCSLPSFGLHSMNATLHPPPLKQAASGQDTAYACTSHKEAIAISQVLLLCILQAAATSSTRPW